MKIKFVDSNEMDQQIRNSQIILCFCMNECILQTKVECNERANLIKIIWANVIYLFRILEIMLSEEEKEFEKKITEIKNLHKIEINKLNENHEKKFKEFNLNIAQLQDKNEYELDQKNDMIIKNNVMIN